MKTKSGLKLTSQLLISTLIASSFLLVNCNKGTDKRGLKVDTTKAKTADQKQSTGASGDDTTAVKNVKCTDEIQKSLVDIYNMYAQIEKERKENLKEASPKSFKNEYEKILLMCDVMGELLGKQKISACTYLDSKKQEQNLAKAPAMCVQAGVALAKETSVENKYSILPSDQDVLLKKKVEQKVNSSEAFLQEKLLMSDEMKTMLKQENLNFSMYIVDGVIKTNQAEMKKYFAGKKVVCSFMGTSTEIVEKGKVFLQAVDYIDVDKTDLAENINAAGISFLTRTEEPSNSSGDAQTLGCSHLLKDKIDIKLLKKALGQHLAVESDLKKVELKQTAAAAATEKAQDVFRKSEIEQMNADKQ